MKKENIWKYIELMRVIFQYNFTTELLMNDDLQQANHSTSHYTFIYFG